MHCAPLYVEDPEKALLEILCALKLTALKLGSTEVPFRRTAGVFTELGAKKWPGHAMCVANNDSGAVLIIGKVSHACYFFFALVLQCMTTGHSFI